MFLPIFGSSTGVINGRREGEICLEARVAGLLVHDRSVHDEDVEGRRNELPVQGATPRIHKVSRMRQEISDQQVNTR